MFEILYFLLFWGFALLYIFLKSVRKNEIKLKVNSVIRLSEFSTSIKGIPAAMAIIFVFVIQPGDLIFYLTLMGALLFCLAGDLGMEKGLIPGLPLFLIAQTLFFIAFLCQSVVNIITIGSLVLPILIALGISIYLLFFIRYLESSEKGLGKFRIPVIIYCIIIGLMLVSTILLWTTSMIAEILLVVLGGVLFIISDSIIAVKEFHHEISYREIKVMSTYYSAIFLLSLSSLFF